MVALPLCENAIYIVIEKKGALYPPAPYDLATGREAMEINLGYNPSELEQYAYIRPHRGEAVPQKCTRIWIID